MKTNLVFASVAAAAALAPRIAVADVPPPDPNMPPMHPPSEPVTPGDPTPFAADRSAPQVAPTAQPADDVPQPPPPEVSSMTSPNSAMWAERPGPYSYAWRAPYMKSGVGVGVTVGGGLTGFTDRTMRDTVSSSVGGLWDVRASLGTHIPIGIDLSYLGTAANIRTISGASNGTLIGTTVEAALRYNILPHYMIDPYVFAGAGWQRYDVRNMQFARSDTGLASKDNVAEFPMGAGVAVRDSSGLNLELRGTFRATTDSTLLQTGQSGTSGTYAALYAWEASGAVGYEF